MIPRISFIIPCYNQAHFLAEALDSLRRQSVSDWEAVVVDDASSVGDPAAVVKEFGDGRVVCVRHPEERGLGATRNTAVRAARADLIMPLDADDRVPPDFLERHLDAFTDPDVDYVFTDVLLFGAQNGLRRFGPFQPADFGDGQPLCGNSAYRRHVWAGVGGYYEKLDSMGNEDWDFWMAATAKGYRGRYLPLPLYEYRQAAASMTGRLKADMWRAHEFVFQRQRAFLEQHGAGEAFLRYGYEGSVRAYVHRGDYPSAVPLAVRARAQGSRDGLILGLAKLEAVPSWAIASCAAVVLAPWRLRRLRTNGLGVRARLRQFFGRGRRLPGGAVTP